MALKFSNTKLLRKAFYNYATSHVSTRASVSRTPQAVFIEKSVEHPVLVLAENDDVDIIGPPDPVSNLRPVIRKHFCNETALQQRLREMHDETQNWNQIFWAKHNTNFKKKKQEFIDSCHSVTGETKQLTADEMSLFYKKFLDDNWEMHAKYNLEWYKRNFTLLFLALSVSLEKNFNKFS